MPLLMSKDLGDLRDQVTRLFEGLGDEGLEIVFGRSVSIEEAVHTVLREVPAAQRSSMMLDEVENKEIDPERSGDELAETFGAADVGELALMTSNRVLEMDDGGDPEAKWGFLDKVMGVFKKGLMQPMPVALIHAPKGSAGTIPAELTKEGVHCIVAGDKDDLIRRADAFQPSFIGIDAADLDDCAADARRGESRQA